MLDTRAQITRNIAAAAIAGCSRSRRNKGACFLSITTRRTIPANLMTGVPATSDRFSPTVRTAKAATPAAISKTANATNANPISATSARPGELAASAPNVSARPAVIPASSPGLAATSNGRALPASSGSSRHRLSALKEPVDPGRQTLLARCVSPQVHREGESADRDSSGPSRLQR